jgi:hypothetical protein
MSKREEREAKWLASMAEHLVGRKIVGVRLMTDGEARKADWYERSVVLVTEKDGNIQMLWPSRDDEGNGPGAIFTTFDKLPILPVFRLAAEK